MVTEGNKSLPVLEKKNIIREYNEKRVVGEKKIKDYDGLDMPDKAKLTTTILEKNNPTAKRPLDWPRW